jgi:hypothetical protein
MLPSPLQKLQQLDLPLLLLTMTIDVFSVAEAGAHFDLTFAFPHPNISQIEYTA